MTSEPKSPEQCEARDERDSTRADAQAVGGARRKYSPPRVKCLGSVRDLTLGSPVGLLMDGLPGGKRTM
jgi:hypothetical protein